MKQKLVIIIAFFCAQFLFAQEFEQLPKTNIEIINTLLQDDFEKCIECINIFGSDKIYLILSNNNKETTEYIIKLFKQIYINYKLTTDTNIQWDYILRFDDAKIKTEYKLVEKNFIFNKNLLREIFCEFNFKILNKDSVLYNKKFSNFTKDTLNYSYLNYIESDTYKFSKGKLPQESFWDKYLIPSAAILVSAIAIILFFTVRSK